MSSDSIVVYVQSIRGGNALPFECLLSERVSSLAEKIKQSARRFKLDSADIDLVNLDLFVCLPDDRKRKLRFNEGLDIVKDNIIEFDCHLEQQRELYVQHSRSINPMKVKIPNDKKVCDLVDVIIQNARDLSIPEAVAESLKEKKSEVKLMVKSSDGQLESLNPFLSIAELDRDNVIFDIETEVTKTRGRPMKIYVKPVSGGRTQTVVCWENDTVFDVINEIKEDVQRFGLGEDMAAEVVDPDKMMVLLEPETKLGQQAAPMKTLDSACDLKDKLVSFQMVSHRQEQIKIDDLVPLCVGQTIAFIGAAGHGKSSTINTIAEVIPDIETPLADTWNKYSAGTMVISPHAITIGGNNFNLLDVPGDGLGGVESQQERQNTGSTIKWILQGKFPKDVKPGFWKDKDVLTAWFTYLKRENTGKVDAVVIVHDGSADTVDMLDKVVVDKAREQRGNGIPVLAVMTHVDKLDNNDVIRDKIKEMSIATGIDEANVFPLSNLRTQRETYLRGSEKDQYVLLILKHMLSRSKRFKENV